MENQHRKISGYRELSQPEIDLMNEIKAKGEELQQLCNKVAATNKQKLKDIQAHGAVEGYDEFEAAEPGRWLSMARTDLQVGIMKLVRAVAKPPTF